MEKEVKLNQPQLYRIYKINKNVDKGAATQFQLSVKDCKYGEDVMVFAETTKQTGFDSNENASFAWKDKELTITVKLEEVDIGEILAVLSGLKTGLGPKEEGLYHSNARGSSTLNLKASLDDNGKLKGYYWNISRKVNETNVVTRYNHTVSIGEAEILRLLLVEAVQRKFRWKY